MELYWASTQFTERLRHQKRIPYDDGLKLRGVNVRLRCFQYITDGHAVNIPSVSVVVSGRKVVDHEIRQSGCHCRRRFVPDWENPFQIVGGEGKFLRGDFLAAN